MKRNKLLEYNIVKLKIARCPLLFNESGLFINTEVTYVKVCTFAENHPYSNIFRFLNKVK